MNNISVNFLAIIVVAVIEITIGMLWYSPAIFGKQWMNLIGFTDQDMKKTREKGMGKSLLIASISALIIGYVLSLINGYRGANTYLDGMVTGFLCWVGFIATVMTGIVAWEKKSWKLYFINSCYYLVALLIMGGILALWK